MNLNPRDQALVSTLQGFVPSEIYDIHAQLHVPEHPAAGGDGAKGALGCAEHRGALGRYLQAGTVHGLYFSAAEPVAERLAMNDRVAVESAVNGTPLSRTLASASPSDDPAKVAADLRSGRFCGLKVCSVYAGRADPMNAEIEEYAPEWMWELVNEVNGVLLLHVARGGSIVDRENQRPIRRLCKAYRRALLVLTHVGRSGNHCDLRSGLLSVADLENVVVDTAAVTETEAFRAALEILGPRRILWGSGYPASELRGSRVAAGTLSLGSLPEDRRKDEADSIPMGIESLICLREASEGSGLAQGDIKDIFLNNALRALKGHLPKIAQPAERTGVALWAHAREVIAGGTGLLSKRAEMFDGRDWPAYFSRCSGCEVWDLAGRRYLDFAGGIGAVVLGYADPDVTAAVRRRLMLGTYCTLVSPQEVELADTLLALHPWASKVRYCRGGGEALMIAVRLARAATGRSGIAFCGYHGWHDWYLAANLAESTALDGHLIPGLEPRGVPRELRGTSVPFRYNDLPSLKAALNQLNGRLAAVVMEPMRSHWPEDDFVAKAAAMCRAAGAVFVVDEVSSGLRFGLPGALSRLGVEPDLVAYAKAMGNGFPFGAVVGRGEIFKAAGASFISSSYWTDGVGPAAALAVLAKVQRLRVHEVVWERGGRLQASLRQIAASHPGCRLSVGGLPAVPSMTFDLGADAPLASTLFARRMLDRGFIVGSAFYVMLAHEETMIAQLIEAMDPVMEEIEAVIASGRLAEEAGVERGLRGFARLA